MRLMLVALLGVVMMGAGAATRPATTQTATKPAATQAVKAAAQPAAPMDLAGLCAAIPADYWPTATKDKQRSIRDGYIADKLKGQRVAITFTITAGNEIGINGKQTRACVCGNTADMLVEGIYAKKGIDSLKGHKVGDTVTVVGELQKLRVGGINPPVGEEKKVDDKNPALLHAITLKRCEIIE